MEKLKKVLQEIKNRLIPPTEEDEVNQVREYLQVLVLKLIFQSKFGPALSFMGETALRICYDLKRYSENLDFTLDDQKTPYRFSLLVKELKRKLHLSGFDVSTNIHEDKIVQKAMLRFAGLSETLGWRNFRKGEKLHIKIEVDVHPIPLKARERETFFVHRFGEIFPILKHDLSTLFAGKILAILLRPYSRGRDYYDLIWYLSRKTEMNLNYLNRGLEKKKLKTRNDVIKALRKKIHDVKPDTILKDIGRFLEDPKEADWISHYRDLFEQLILS